MLFSCSCQSTKTETFQGDPHRLKSTDVIVKTIHERNFQIWLKNQKQFAGMSSFRATPSCPSAMGH